MRVFVYQNRDKFIIRALEGAAKGRIVARATLFILRDATSVSDFGLRGELEAFRGETTPFGDAAGLIPLWTKCDRAYRAYGQTNGRAHHFSGGLTSPLNGAAMVCGAPGGRLWAFDPCDASRPFPED